MTVSLQPVLRAPSPSAWLEEHLHARFASPARDDGSESLATYTLDEVLADDADLLRTIHARLVAGGTPPPAAATYLADWFGGIVAVAVGFGLAAAGAGFVCDREDRGQAIRFHVHPNGWPCRVELRARALVTCDHHWATDRVPGHETVDSVEQAIHRTVRELVETVAPIVVACRSLASVGTVGSGTRWPTVSARHWSTRIWSIPLRRWPRSSAPHSPRPGCRGDRGHRSGSSSRTSSAPCT